MPHLEKQGVLDAVKDTVVADGTISSWAGLIQTVDDDPTQEKIAQARTRRNFIFVRDGGLRLIEKGTSSRVQEMMVDIAVCAQAATRVRDAAGRSVLGIDDDIRRVLTDNTTMYSASGVSILEATITDSPPTATVWGELYENAAESGHRMSVVQLKLRIYERR